MNEPRQYRKKPVTISAMQWDGTAAGATPIINWILKCGGSASYDEHVPGPGRGVRPGIRIRTLEGSLYAWADYFVIQGVEGEFYGCQDDIFFKTYDAVH